MPAIERYDGPIYRVLRKAKKEGFWPDQLEILIVSAEYGLIKADELIDFYDRKMTPARAEELRPRLAEELEAKLANSEYRIWVNLGQLYLSTLPSLPSGTHYADRFFEGQMSRGFKIGERCAQVKKWLAQMKEDQNG